SGRSRGRSGSVAMRWTRSEAVLRCPRRSKGVWPASSEYTVAASENTSERTSARGGSAKNSGGDQGIDMPWESSTSFACPAATEAPRAVRGLAGAGDLHPDPQRLGHGDPLLAEAHPVVRPWAVLHDDVRAVIVGDLGLVDRDDRRMRRHLRHHVGLGVEQAS